MILKECSLTITKSHGLAWFPSQGAIDDHGGDEAIDPQNPCHDHRNDGLPWLLSSVKGRNHVGIKTCEVRPAGVSKTF